jgi:hypothetical protein
MVPGCVNTGDPEPEHDEELEEYASEMEKVLGRKFEPGRGNSKCLRLTLDKVEMSHRSLTWYLVIKWRRGNALGIVPLTKIWVLIYSIL